MNKVILSILFLWVFTEKTHSQSAFSSLQRLEVDSNYHVSVYYNPRNCTLLKQSIKNEADIYEMYVLRSRLVPSSPDSFLVEYNEGPSADPGFIFYRVANDSLLPLCYKINGLNLFVPGNGFLYIDGHTDDMFNRRRKYVVSRDSIKEVPQPFYYVGLDSKTKEEIRLYADSTNTQVVATVPKGSTVHVLLNKGEDYLIKTEFGLIGWLRIEDGSPNTPIEGIYWAGD
jgi:hypothetical protein